MPDGILYIAYCGTGSSDSAFLIFIWRDGFLFYEDIEKVTRFNGDTIKCKYGIIL